jgi:HSP20 family protein
MTDDREEQTSKELQTRRERPFSLFQEMDKMMRQFEESIWRPFRSTMPTFNESLIRTPLANVTEKNDAYEINVEVPGLDKKEIDVSYHKGLLEITSKSEESQEETTNGEEVVRREYHSKKYYRAFNLPETIEEDEIEAELNKGILKIAVPKKEVTEEDKKTIEVN